MKLISSLRSWGTIALALGALTSCGGDMSSMSGSMGSSANTASGSTGSGSTMTPCTGSCGGMLMTLSDAPGDFVSYVVNVVSVQLTRADGTTVAVLPTTTQVDFAQLVDLSEVVSAAQIPAGNYVSAQITLDFANAMIIVDNGSTGVTISSSNIVNAATSQPLAAPYPTQVTLTLELGTQGSFAITPNAIANLALDFNLVASNTIAPSATNPTTVTVNPVLTANVMPDPTKQIRVRGPLVSVSATSDSFAVGVRPFFNASGTSGDLTVTTTSDTAYSIGGTSYSGSAGLTQLVTLQPGTVVAAYGSFDVTKQTFTATNVLAGSSVASSTLATLYGTVVARSGNTLTLMNGLMYGPASMGQGGLMNYSSQLTVAVGAGTVVTRNGEPGAFTAQDISVGQHVIVTGTSASSASMSMGMGDMNGMDGMDMGMNMGMGLTSASFDATSGSVQMTATTLLGVATAVTPTLVTMNLQSLDGRSVSNFNFAGTGMTSMQDASGGAYTVSLPAALQGTSAATSVAVSQPVQFSGFVTSFGAAPPDFVANSLTNFGNTRALLSIRWASPGVTMPFATQTSSGLSISQAMLAASAQEFIQVATLTDNPALLGAGLQISPDMAAVNPQFAIGHLKSHMIDNFSTFSDFVTALATELNGSNEALRVIADGPYNSSTGVFSADQMVVVTND